MNFVEHIFMDIEIRLTYKFDHNWLNVDCGDEVRMWVAYKGYEGPVFIFLELLSLRLGEVAYQKLSKTFQHLTS